MAKMVITFHDLPEKLAKFIEFKMGDPIRLKYGKHDGRMTGPLNGFWHTHLRDDAVLIYGMKFKTLTLIDIVTHADMQGKRGRQLANRLAPYKYA